MTDHRETGLTLDPKYDAAGLVTAVVTDRVSGDVLMVAHMNADALAATRSSGGTASHMSTDSALWRTGLLKRMCRVLASSQVCTRSVVEV